MAKSIIKTGSDPAFDQILAGWELRKNYSSAQLSSLVPFVQLYALLKPGLDDILIGAVPDDLQYNATLYKKRIALSGPNDQEQVILCDVNGMLSQTESFSTKGDIGINELKINREVRTLSSARYDISIIFPDSRIFDEKIYLTKLLQLQSQYVIIYGWLDRNTYSINLPGVQYAPPPEPDNERNLQIEIGQPNLGFWSAEKVNLFKFGYNIDQTGHVVGDLGFIGSGYAKGLFEKNSYVSSLALDKLRNLTIDLETLNCTRFMVEYWKRERGFNEEQVLAFYTGRFENLRYSELIFAPHNSILQNVQKPEDLRVGNNRITLTKAFFDENFYLYGFGDPTTNPSAAPGSIFGQELLEDQGFTENNDYYQTPSQGGSNYTYVVGSDGLVDATEYLGSGRSIPPQLTGQLLDFPLSSTIFAELPSDGLTNKKYEVPNDIEPEFRIDAYGNKIYLDGNILLPLFDKQSLDWVVFAPSASAPSTAPRRPLPSGLSDNLGEDILVEEDLFTATNISEPVPYIGTIPLRRFGDVEGTWVWQFFSKNAAEVYEYILQLYGEGEVYQSYKEKYDNLDTASLTPDQRLKRDELTAQLLDRYKRRTNVPVQPK